MSTRSLLIAVGKRFVEHCSTKDEEAVRSLTAAKKELDTKKTAIDVHLKGLQSSLEHKLAEAGGALDHTALGC